MRDCYFPKGHIDIAEEWPTLFSIIVCFLWKDRNASIFYHMNSNSSDLIGLVVAWARSFLSAKLKINLESFKVNRGFWESLTEGWIKLNTDGPFLNHLSRATVGGVFRGSNGGWVSGFSMKVGGSDIFQVEARAIYEGHKLAWSRGFSRIEVDYDNAILIEFICKGFAAESRVPELRLIHSLCRRNWRVVFKHSSSEYNRGVDGLAKAAKGDYNQLQIFEFPPYYIRRFLEKDNQVMLGNFPALQSAAN
ncbi:hypothetical protein Goklo_029812 [Gossypium klotzschianum]|uniref:RNase H type-1 domain-containing protein n=2 Tax=Gossypium TaxID=3633 RepID=A0A7J8WF25_9ROSI|nr:hypothetical protein [Gossypium klotzschianum]